MPESPERRAQRKLEARAYRFLPSREILQAATQLEQAKMERATREGQLAVQEGSLAVAVLSQIPRDVDDNRSVFAAARALLEGILKKGRARLESADEDDEIESDDDQEEPVA